VARLFFPLLFVALACAPLPAQYETDTVSQALRQGQYLESRRKYDLALDAYRWANKQARHSSSKVYLSIAALECRMGRFSDALDDAKRAEDVAAGDKALAVQARVLRAAVLTQLAGKPRDKKLKEAETELRAALALDPDQPNLHFDLGMVLLKQGSDAEGIAELKAYAASPRITRESSEAAQRIIANPIRARAPFAPDFTFLTLEGQKMSNATLRGKVVLLDFWGTWCGPCREAVPMLRTLEKEFSGQEFVLVGISDDDDEKAVRKFTQAQQMDWAEHVDASGDVMTAFKVESFPTFVVMDKDGVIRFRQSGFGPPIQADLEEAINKARRSSMKAELAGAYSADGPAAEPETATPDEDAPPSAVERASVEGGVYTNPALRITYRLPPGWVALSPEALHRFNIREKAATRAALARLRTGPAHPELVPIPDYVLYASGKDPGDGEHVTVPSLRMAAGRTQATALSLEVFDRFTLSLTAVGGLKLRRAAASFTLNGHEFLRSDLERHSGGGVVFEALIQTLTGDGYLLQIESYGATALELQKIVDSLQTLSFSDAAH